MLNFSCVSCHREQKVKAFYDPSAGPICQLVQNAQCNLYVLPNTVVLQMVQQLIQRLHFEGPIKVFISLQGVGTSLTIHNDDCFHD